MKQLFSTLFVLLLLWSGAMAQGTETQIGGVVSSKSEGRLVGANVFVKNESTGYTTGSISDLDGRFLIQDLPVGGPYTVKISFMGFGEYVAEKIQLSQGDRINLGTIELNDNINELESVIIEPDFFSVEQDRLGEARKINSKMMNSLPSPSRNYASFAELSPLARSGTQMAGAKGSMTGLTIDGVSNRRGVFGDLSGGAFPVSMEAIEEFEVATNSYDVTAGRGGAGTIKAITKSGTNDFHASAWTYFANDALTGNKFSKNGLLSDQDISENINEGNTYSTTQFGLSLSGPIIKDKLHFFLVGDYYKKNEPWASHWDYENKSEEDLRVKEDDLVNAINILENQHGIPGVVSDKLGGYTKQYGVASGVPQKTISFLGKLDWTINEKNSASLKYNYHSFSNPRKLIGRGIFSAQYGEESYDHSFQLNLNTQVSPTQKNTLRLSTNYMLRPGEPYNGRVPVGRVFVESDFGNGNTDGDEMFWGNQYWAPEIISQRAYQLIDNYTWLLGKSRVTAGVDIYHERISDQLTHYQQGEFFYASVEDLINNTPYRYERKTPLGNAGGRVKPSIFETGIYGQIQTYLHDDVEFTAGLRWDAAFIPVKPTYNALLEQELGIRNDVAPKDLNNFQPRFNLIWDINGKGNDILKVGGGAFVSQFTTQALTMSHIDNGVSYAWPVIQVGMPYADGSGRVVTQEDLPTPNWSSYYESFDNVPGEEYVNELVAKGILSTDVPAYVVAIDENLKSPYTWKFNVGYFHKVNDWLNVGVSGYYNSTLNNSYYTNLNLKENAEFTLDNEGGRDVYVPASTLNENSTSANWLNSRKSDKFNQVTYYTSADWANTYMALVLEANMKWKDGSVNISYTRGASKGAVQYTSGNAREYHYVGQSYQGFGDLMSRSYDMDDMKQKFLITAVSPSFHGFSISTKFSMIQSERFRASMNSRYDIAGVGTNNSSTNYMLPFIFDINDSSLPEDFRADYQELLNTTSPEYKEYLMDNMGGIAQPFGGINPIRTSWDLSASKTFTFNNKHRVILRGDVFNVLNLMNYKWGGYHYISNTDLYDVTGFDVATEEYQYKIRPNAGKKYYRVNNPYTVQFGLKYIF